jgi:hypothetical protein
VDDNEKEKLDYQMKLEKEKLIFARSLRWFELAFDKLGLLILGGLALFPINCYFESRRQADAHVLEEQRQAESKNLEAFKLEEARKRYLMEKRFEALTAISSAHNVMTAAFFSSFDPGVDLEKQRAAHKAGIDRFIESINRNLPVLTSEFDANMNRYVQVHRSIRDIDPARWQNYRTFLSDLDNEFNELCRTFLNSGEMTKRMTLKPIRYEDRIKLTPEKYLSEQVEFQKTNRKE